MFDIITFGSATKDIFIRFKTGNFQILKQKSGLKRDFCFPLGSKIRIKDLIFQTGGGGTNTACTFSNQGLKTAYCGKIGDDKEGEFIIEELKNFRVYTDFVLKDKFYQTALSLIFSFGEQGRTIFTYKGASHFLKTEDLPFKKIKANWFYLGPFYEQTLKTLEKILDFAKKNRIKIALNPSIELLNRDKDILKSIFSRIDILFLNREESAYIIADFNIKRDREIFNKLQKFVTLNNKRIILVMTIGDKGAFVFNGKNFFSVKALPLKAKEMTGAGDAFASGFLSALIKKNDIKFALRFASANAASCIQKIGAKKGLLKNFNFNNLPKLYVSKHESIF